MKEFWRFARMLLKYRRLFVFAGIGVMIDALCQLGGIGTLTWIVQQFFQSNTTIRDLLSARLDKLAASGIDLRWVLTYVPHDAWLAMALTLGVIVVLAILGSCGRFIHEYCTLTATMRTVMRLRRAVFMRLVHLPMSTSTQGRTAERASRVVRDCEALGRGFNAMTARSVRGTVVGFVLLLGAVWNDWFLTLVFLVVVPPIGVLIQKFSKKIRRASRRAMIQYGVMLGALTESLQGLRIVKVHQAEGYERRRFNVINRSVLVQQMHARTARALSSPVVETLSMMGLSLVVLIAAWGLYHGGKSTGTLVSVIVMLGASATSFRQLTGLNNTLQEAAAAAENIAEVLELDIESGPGSIDARHKLPRHSQSVRFDNIVFTYPGSSRQALRGISLDVPHGSICAIVGSNGSGKSTLLGLMPRLYEPDSGRILIDGVDIARCTLRSVRSQIAMVTQDTVLFDGTIEQNIAYGWSQASHEQIVEAAKRAHAHEFITAKPEGYDTQVGERGQSLSGGQRQRIAIARAILRDPAILILDEATSQIDSESEAQITEALAQFVKDRTTFVIAHRLSTVVNADMIVVLADGSIASIGTHRELLEKSDIYRVLCKTQLHMGDV